MNTLIISGPSGIGKSYIVKSLSKTGLYDRVVPTTTRQARDGEINGVDYHFVSEHDYEKLWFSDHFFMSNSFFNAQYGISREAVESIFRQRKIPVAEIYTPLVAQFLNEYPDSTPIFLMPDSFELLEERMRLRGDREETIQSRVESAAKEILYFNSHGEVNSLYRKCYHVVNDHIDFVLKDIYQMNLENNEDREGNVKNV